MSTKPAPNFTHARRVTDIGPPCSGCGSAEGEGLWLYLCDYPYQVCAGRCASCNTVVEFAVLPTGERPPGEPDLGTIKRAHRRWIDSNKPPGTL